MSNIENEYIKVLNEAKDERPLQKFLEKHPFILQIQFCSAWNFVMLLPQINLGGKYIPDFMLITGHSGKWIIHFIEIESPMVSVFNKDGTYAKKTNYAIKQITDWAIWTENNREAYIDILASIVGKRTAFTNGFTPDMRANRHSIENNHHIIIGRSSNMSEEDRARRGISELVNYNILSYDRLISAIKINPQACAKNEYPIMNKIRKRYISKYLNGAMSGPYKRK
ncbi:hypothetical protein LBMAG53_21950 [Planctomycetota bacterium]|nr:hypothetical protein LBMAG53_21950 [Planctomycetota bacterium]